MSYAYAVSVDFEASAPYGSYSQCSCSSVVSEINVYNTGDFPANFFLRFGGSLKDYTVASPSVLHLDAKEKGHFMVFVNLPCNWYGRKDLKIYISNDLNIEKVIVQRFNLKKCSNVELCVIQKPKKACKCSIFDYKLELKNTGRFEETYHFSVPGMDKVKLPEDLKLKPNATKEVNLTVVPKCSFTGDKIEVVVSSELAEQENIFKLPIEIDKTCSAKKSNYANIWVPIGLSALILLIALIVIISRKRKNVEKKRPELVRFEPGKKTNRKFVLFSVLFFIALGIASYFSYVYVPKLVAGLSFPSFSHLWKGFLNLDIWFYVIIGVVLLIVMLVIAWLSGPREGSFLSFLFKLLLTLLILGILICIAWFVWSYRIGIVKFLALYYIYIIAGFVILALIIIFTKQRTFEEKFICEFCGKEFKTERGLKNHITRVHKAR